MAGLRGHGSSHCSETPSLSHRAMKLTCYMGWTGEQDLYFYKAFTKGKQSPDKPLNAPNHILMDLINFHINKSLT